MRFIGRGLIGLMLLMLTLGILLVAGNSIYQTLQAREDANNQPRIARERVFTVNVETIELGTATPVISTFGEVASGRTLDLRAASNGTIISLSPKFRNGGKVSKGEVLIQIDPTSAIASHSWHKLKCRMQKQNSRKPKRL